MDAMREGVWLTKKTKRNGDIAPVICVYGGGNRIDQIYPGMGSTIHKHKKAFDKLLDEQAKMMGVDEDEE